MGKATPASRPKPVVFAVVGRKKAGAAIALAEQPFAVAGQIVWRRLNRVVRLCVAALGHRLTRCRFCSGTKLSNDGATPGVAGLKPVHGAVNSFDRLTSSVCPLRRPRNADSVVNRVVAVIQMPSFSPVPRPP